MVLYFQYGCRSSPGRIPQVLLRCSTNKPSKTLPTVQEDVMYRFTKILSPSQSCFACGSKILYHLTIEQEKSLKITKKMMNKSPSLQKCLGKGLNHLPSTTVFINKHIYFNLGMKRYKVSVN